MQLKAGHVAVVTGGAAGMGRQLCVQLAARGCAVATCDIDAAALAETAAECEAAAPGCTVLTHQCDVSDEQACLDFAEAVRTGLETDHINALFNNVCWPLPSPPLYGGPGP
eukprot:COSAG04_NODE_3979_length_2382_cov_3.189225_2_plen_111_part_00